MKLVELASVLSVLPFTSCALLKCVQCERRSGASNGRCLAGAVEATPCPLANHTRCLTTRSTDTDTGEESVLWRQCGTAADVRCSVHSTGNGLAATDAAWESSSKRRTRDHSSKVKVCMLGCSRDGCNAAASLVAPLSLSVLCLLFLAAHS